MEKKPSKTNFEFTPKAEAAFLNRIEGGETIMEICTTDDQPTRQAVYKRAATHPEFKAKLEAAHQCQSHCLVDEAVTTMRRAKNKVTGYVGKHRADICLRVAGLRNPAYRPATKTEVSIVDGLADRLKDARQRAGKAAS